MRIENWDTKLSDYIQKQQHIKFRYGNSDCVNFVIGAIKTVTGKVVFDTEYKSIKDAKQIIQELNNSYKFKLKYIEDKISSNNSHEFLEYYFKLTKLLDSIDELRIMYLM